MSAVQSTVVFIARELFRGAAQAVGGGVGEAAAGKVLDFLSQRLNDHSQAFLTALHTANERSWRSLEIAMAGDSWWERVKNKLSPAEEQTIGNQLRAYLKSARLDGVTVDREKCLEQLRSARRRKALDIGVASSQDLVKQAGHFAHIQDPTALVQAENRSLMGIAERLRPAYPHLAALLTVQASKGDTLLAIAMRYFFRRAIEQDPPLARGLAFLRMEKLQDSQEAGFAALHQVLLQRDGRLESLLGDIQTTVRETQEVVLDIQAEQRRQGDQHRLLYDAVIDLQKKLDLMRTEVRPQDSLSIRSDGERRMVRQVAAQFRALPGERRRQLPALLNGIGKLEVAAGDFDEAENAFQAVADAVSDPAARGEARFNAYRAALERRDWPGALRQLLEAVKLDANRFTPFPMGKYQPQAILGAGGFGVAFLCYHKELQDKVVVKTLLSNELDRDADTVLDEARVLWKLQNPAIIGVCDCGYVLPKAKSRPYIVMRYFDGTTLEDCVKQQPLAVEDILLVARQVADGLQAAHANGVLHRDVKPANILVRKDGDAWQVKLIDFGLAVRQSTLASVDAASKSLVGSTIAGTVDYAAPEQMGKLPGTSIGPYSDVYGFGKACCYALFRTPTPLHSHWKSIPPSLATLLEECLAEAAQDRPRDFEEVCRRLNKVRRRRRRPDAGDSVVIEAAPPGSPTHQLPSNLVAKELAEVSVFPRGRKLVVRVLMKPSMENAKSEGWQTGVALDGSASMRSSFGLRMKGNVPPEIMADYEKRSWLSSEVVDGRSVKKLKPAAHEDAIRRGLLRPADNIVQPLARGFIGLLADRLDADGGTSVIYWACADGSGIEVLGDFTATQCRTLELLGPKQFGTRTRLVPAVRYFVERFADAPKGLYVFLADGNFDDFAEVKQYTTDLARAIAAGQSNMVKCVLVGVGNNIDAGPMEELDDLDTGTGVDIWDHKIAKDMRDLTDIFAELAEENEIVALKAKVYDANGAVVKRFAHGMPAKIEFTLSEGTPWFEIELPNQRIRQPLSNGLVTVP